MREKCVSFDQTTPNASKSSKNDRLTSLLSPRSSACYDAATDPFLNTGEEGRHKLNWKPEWAECIVPGMAKSKEEPVMLPIQDKEGTGWHVVIRYHTGHERRIEGFATEKEALDWIIANSKEVDQ